MSKGFHITRSLCSEGNQVPSGKETALQLLRERMAEVFACPASIPFSSGNASLSSLSVHRARADITSRFVGMPSQLECCTLLAMGFVQD